MRALKVGFRNQNGVNQKCTFKTQPFIKFGTLFLEKSLDKFNSFLFFTRSEQQPPTQLLKPTSSLYIYVTRT